jgi:bacterioferritin (cytochrome b1)
MATAEEKIAEVKKVSAIVKQEYTVENGQNIETTEYANGTIKRQVLHKEHPKFKSAEEVAREGNTAEQLAIADLQAQVAALTEALKQGSGDSTGDDGAATKKDAKGKGKAEPKAD